MQESHNESQQDHQQPEPMETAQQEENRSQQDHQQPEPMETAQPEENRPQHGDEAIQVDSDREGDAPQHESQQGDVTNSVHGLIDRLEERSSRMGAAIAPFGRGSA